MAVHGFCVIKNRAHQLYGAVEESKTFALPLILQGYRNGTLPYLKNAIHKAANVSTLSKTTIRREFEALLDDQPNPLFAFWFYNR